MHKLFRGLFPKRTDEDEEPSTPSGTRLTKTYGWFKTIKDVSVELNENWDTTAQRNVIDFLSKLQYLMLESEIKREEFEQQKLINGL